MTQSFNARPNGASCRLLLQACTLALTLGCGAAQAQAWPAKPVSLVVPFPAGGTSDMLAGALVKIGPQSARRQA